MVAVHSDSQPKTSPGPAPPSPPVPPPPLATPPPPAIPPVPVELVLELGFGLDSSSQASGITASTASTQMTLLGAFMQPSYPQSATCLQAWPRDK
ncbi:MAG: hypothetical protein DRI90_27905 [Deltaproteobacteria bacterium]|nr:MAG: hypothetical protein DRI90_27905 [Deltaproteobacteria bacterium]